MLVRGGAAVEPGSAGSGIIIDCESNGMGRARRPVLVVYVRFLDDKECPHG